MIENLTNNIFFIGGVSCSGKSTLSNMLVKKYDMYLYRCDKHFHLRKRKSNPLISPTIFNLTKRDIADILINDSIEKQFYDYLNFLREDFNLIVKDLSLLSTNKPILVEGNQLLPQLVLPYLSDSKKAIWIIPDEEFMENNFNKRKFINNKLNSSTNPTLGKNNWIKRNSMLIDYIKESVAENSLNSLLISSEYNIENNFNKLEYSLNLNI